MSLKEYLLLYITLHKIYFEMSSKALNKCQDRVTKSIVTIFETISQYCRDNYFHKTLAQLDLS